MSLFFLVLHLRNLAAKLNRPLLLLGSALEPQTVRRESQDQLLSQTSPQPEVALQAQLETGQVVDKVLVKERIPRRDAMVADNPVVSAQVSLRYSANVHLDFRSQHFRSPFCKGCSMSAITTKLLIDAHTHDNHSGSMGSLT